MSVMNTFEFTVGERVRGEFGMGTIRHIHGKKATVEYGYGLKLQIKLCHLKHLEVGGLSDILTHEVHQQVHEVEGKKFPPLLNLYAQEWEGVMPCHDLSQENSNSLLTSLNTKGLLQKDEVLDSATRSNSFSRAPTYLKEVESLPAAQLLEDSVRQGEIFSLTESQRWPTYGSCICPSCQQQLQRQDDGCGVCGWVYVGIENSPSKDVDQSRIYPSNNNPSKKRRRKGDGNGCIHWRTITKNGLEYPQAYYHWKENGLKRTKYIPKQLLGTIQEAEAAKRPVTEILSILRVTHNLSKNCVLGDIEISPSIYETVLNISPSNKSPSKEVVLGDIEISPSKEADIDPSNDISPSKEADIDPSNDISPSKEADIDPSNDISPSKMRRHKGEGSGSNWHSPSKEVVLGDIEISPSKEVVLGDIEISPSKEVVLGDIEISPSKEADIDPSNDISPSKMRRHKGEGSGSIYWRILTKNGKDYPQAYYHYEFWSEGDRLIKSTKYIPKRLLSRLQELEAEKAPVREILSLLGVKW